MSEKSLVIELNLRTLLYAMFDLEEGELDKELEKRLIAKLREVLSGVEGPIPIAKLREVREMLLSFFVPKMPPWACKHLEIRCRMGGVIECPCAFYEPREEGSGREDGQR